MHHARLIIKVAITAFGPSRVTQWRLAKEHANMTQDVSQSFFGQGTLHVFCITRFLLQLFLTVMEECLLV